MGHHETDITHTGIVARLEANKAIVQTKVSESCHSCRLKSFCGMDDEERVSFVIPDDHFKVGEKVIVHLSHHKGLMAVFWAYLLPFLVLLSVLVIGEISGWKEVYTGLIGLVAVGVYFLVISWFRNRLSNGFNLKVTRE